MAKRIRRKTHSPPSEEQPQAARCSSALTERPNRVSPGHVRMIQLLGTCTGFALIAYDGYMSWLGFGTISNIDLFGRSVMTLLIVTVQLTSGCIQALGGNPLVGLGGNAQGDGIVAWFIKGLYVADFISNFTGWGGDRHLSLGALVRDPFSNLMMAAWIALWSLILVFADEIAFRIRDRLIIGSVGNQQRAKIFRIRRKAHDKALEVWETHAMQEAEAIGKTLGVDFEWIEEDIHD